MILPYNFNGILLNDDFFTSELLGAFGADKPLTLNDLFTDGQAFGRSKVAERKLTLNIVAGNFNLAKIVTLNSMITGNNLKSLIVDTDIGRLIGSAEITNFAWGDDTPLFISAQLTMPDPYWYALTPATVALGSTSNAALVLPAVLPWTLGSVTGGEGTITNSGNADAYPVIMIDGTCANISITSNTTGESISVSASLTDSDTLVIDCNPRTCGVYLNGAANIGLKTTPGWIHCPPGENTFSFLRNSLQDKKHCTVSLQSRWI